MFEDVWLNQTLTGLVQPSLAWLGLIELGLAFLLDLDAVGFAQLGLVRLGAALAGLDWIGFGWFGYLNLFKLI